VCRFCRCLDYLLKKREASNFMSHQDPIADLLTRLRNGVRAKLRFVELYFSRQKHAILKVLQEHGFVDNILVDEEKKKMRIFLKYSEGRIPTIHELKRISKPGLRNYIKQDEIKKIAGGMGIAIISTSQGIIDGEAAREKGIGGELLCYVW
jgi:small subunit ribosomal protein S8